MTGFTAPLTSVLTGVSKSQLYSWKRKKLLLPEVQDSRPPLWSFRDIIALRSLAFLRRDVSLQKITKAFESLTVLEMVEHPAEYRFGTDGTSVFVEKSGGDEAINLNAAGFQPTLFTFEEMFGEFENWKKQTIAPLFKPESHVEVRLGRLGGWPTIAGTRVGYDVISNLVDHETIYPEDVSYYYPTVSAEAAESALRFDARVREAV